MIKKHHDCRLRYGWGWKGPLLLPNLPAQAGSPRADSSPQLDGLLISMRIEFLGQRMPVFWHLTVKKCYLMFKNVFWFVFITSCLITVHQWKEPGSALFVLSLWVFIFFNTMLLSFSFSRLDSQSFSAFPCGRETSVPSSCSSPSLDFLQQISLVLGTHNRTQHCSCLTRTEQKGKDHLPQSGHCWELCLPSWTLFLGLCS